MHAELRIGDSTIMLGDEMPEQGGKGPKSYAEPHPAVHAGGADVLAARSRVCGAFCNVST